MTRDACGRPPESGLPGARMQGADADTGGGEEPPVLEQVFDGDSLYALRAAAAAHASQAGLPDGRVGDLVLTVHELAANAVRHGAGHGRRRIWKAEDALRCEVSDDGPDGVPTSGDAGSQSGDTVPWNMEPGRGLGRASRADHGPGADRRAPRRPDGGRGAARAPAAAASRRRPGQRVHLGQHTGRGADDTQPGNLTVPPPRRRQPPR